MQKEKKDQTNIFMKVKFLYLMSGLVFIFLSVVNLQEIFLEMKNLFKF